MPNWYRAKLGTIVACSLLVALFCISTSSAAEPKLVRLGKEKETTVALWLETSLKRVFPNTEPGSPQLKLLAPRIGTVSFQACVRNNRIWVLRTNCKLEGADGLGARVRLVGLVPMTHFTQATDPKELDGIHSLPGLVPDPLYPETETRIGPQESRSYWITLHIPADAKPGTHELKVRFLLG